MKKIFTQVCKETIDDAVDMISVELAEEGKEIEKRIEKELDKKMQDDINLLNDLYLEKGFKIGRQYALMESAEMYNNIKRD